MGHTGPAAVYELGSRLNTRLQLRDVLVKQRQRALRLTDNHYLVQWQPHTSMWCVIDMAALDEHASACPTFRFRQCCVHLNWISELCAHEAQPRGLRRTLAWPQGDEL